MQVQAKKAAFGDMYNIMQRQNEITAALVQQQLSLSLPPRNIPIFDGNPLEYKAFMQGFQNGMEEKASQADCIYFLEQFMIEHGYALSKGILHEHFGN